MTETSRQSTSTALGETPSSRRGYVTESFGVFFADRTWFVRALVGMLLWNIPILGPMAVAGYALEWIAQTAWGEGDVMPRRPRLGATLLWGLRVVVAQLVWLALALIPLLTGVLIGGGVFFSALMPGSDIEIGTPLRLDASNIVAEVIGALIVVAGVVLFVAFLLLAQAGVARMAVYRRLSAAMPVSGQTAFVLSHKLSFAKAVGTSVLASVPAAAVVVAIENTPAAFALTPPNALHWGLYLPLGLFSFCAAMIAARAFGRCMLEADPSSLPPLSRRSNGAAAATTCCGRAPSEPEGDPRDAEDG